MSREVGMNTGGRDGRILTFYSYKGGVGRTMALANVAWILASNGKRVLIVDWDLESPGLHRYFHPFLVDKQLRDSAGVIDAVRDFAAIATRPGPDAAPAELDLTEIEQAAQIQRYACSLEGYEFPGSGLIDLVPAGRQNSAYSTIVSTFEWGDFYERLGGGVFLDALAADMRRHYDYTLIDSRTGLSDNAGICTVQLPDTVVSCFTMSTQSIDGAAAVARSILDLSRRASRLVRIFPVPMRVEDGEQIKLERSRDYARQKFADVLPSFARAEADTYWGLVEIPYRVFYAYEEVLTAFGDRPRQEGTLLAAYERLTSELVGQPCMLVPPAEPVRLGWLAEFERRAPVVQPELVISHAPPDRAWAEWIADELRAVGQPSVRREIGETLHSVESARRILLLLSREAVRTEEAARLWRHGMSRNAPGPGRFLIPVRLDGSRMPAPFDEHDAVDLFEVPEDTARMSVLGLLGLADAPPLEARQQPPARHRYPGTQPEVWRAPARNPAFTGRDAVLERLRELLSAGTPSKVPVALLGLGGIGKTQIAIEYVHRFAANYDIVWWVSADQTSLVRTVLADLAARLGLPAADATTQVADVRDSLRQGRPSPRWLVVFDNAGEPAQLRDFLPTGPGDVLITSPAQSWAREAIAVEIGVFDRAESVALLSRRVASLAPADAEDVAEKVGDLPLAVEQAAAWLAETAMAPRKYLELLDEHLPRMLDAPPPPGYPQPAAATWRLSLGRLREVNPAAARLLELCAFFAPEPIPTQLLSSPRMVEVLADYDPALRDPMLHGALLRDIGRFALARVDPAVRGLRVHQLVQRVIREGLSPSVKSQSLSQVREILEAEHRGEPDNPANWETYQGLRRHLEHTGMLESDAPAQRQFVFDMTRYLRYRGDLAGGLELSERALEAWRRFGDDDVPTVRLRLEQANLLRAQGRYERSFAIDTDAIERLTRILGEEHAYTLYASASLAADQRERGEYRAARDLDERTLARWRAAFGDDHPRTLMIANNLGVSLRLVGEFAAALAVQQDTLRRRIKMAGDRDYWTLLSRIEVGRCLREVGDLANSHERLIGGLDTCREALGEDHPATINIAKEATISCRQTGDLAAARTLAEDTLKRAEHQLGRRHPLTLSCALELACVLSEQGEHEPARSRAEDVRDSYRQANGEQHLFTLCATNDLAVFLMRAGDYHQAQPLLRHAAQHFPHVLGDTHPYTIVCEMNLSSLMYETGTVDDEVRRLDELSHRGLSGRFGPDHPSVLAAATDLALSRLRTGAVRDAQAQLDDVLQTARRVLGENHHDVLAIQAGRRILGVIEPPPT
jgi:MinD-like ATPase involved in chromosome partitioning or flagellar assembly/tetratricopeptide (TPR) repeat protein